MLNISTPALLFSTISLLLLANTNRFLVLAKLIRELHKQTVHLTHFNKQSIVLQINNLKKRISLIKYTQIFAVMSLATAAVSMFTTFVRMTFSSQFIFGISLLLLIVSLILCLWELFISTRALEIELKEIKHNIFKKK